MAFLVLLAFLSVAGRAQPPVLAGTMPEDYLSGLRPLLEAAMRQSPQMISNQIAIAKSEGAVFSDNAALWPSLSGSTQYMGDKIATNGGPYITGKGIFYNIGVSQPIFQWGALANSSRIGHIDLAISKKNYAEAYRQLALSVRGQYMDLIAKKITLRNERFSLKVYEAALAVAEQKLKNGTLSQGDIVIPQLNVDQTQLDLARSEEDYANARLVLAHLVGIDDVPDGQIPDAVPKPAYDPRLAAGLLDELVRDGARSTLQAQIYEMGIREAKLNYNIQKVRLFPKVSAGASYGLSNSVTPELGNYVLQESLREFQYAVTANWAIFDGLATHGAKLSALAAERAAERELKTYVDTTLEQAQHMKRELDLDARNVELMDRRWDISSGTVRQDETQLKLGQIPQSALDDQMSSFYSTDYATAGARADFLTQWSEFVSLTGYDPAMKNLPVEYVRPFR